MAALILDAGALIAVDRGEPRVRVFLARAMKGPEMPIVPAGALAQAWRGPRQAQLAVLLKSCLIEPLDDTNARHAGELCAAAGTHDVIDASVVLAARRRGGTVLTSDPDDLRHLSKVAGGGVRIVPVGS